MLINRKRASFQTPSLNIKYIVLRFSILIISNQCAILICCNWLRLFTRLFLLMLHRTALFFPLLLRSVLNFLHVGLCRLQPNHSPIHFFTSTHSDYYIQFIISKPHLSVPFADWLIACRFLNLALHLSVAACYSSLLPFNRHFDWFRCAFSNSNFSAVVVVIGVAAINILCFTNVISSFWYAISTALF